MMYFEAISGDSTASKCVLNNDHKAWKTKYILLNLVSAVMLNVFRSINCLYQIKNSKLCVLHVIKVHLLWF